MKWYHLQLPVVIFLCFFQTSTVQAQIKFGAGAGLISDGSTVLLQSRLEIGPRSFKMVGAFNFILENGADWAIDIDGHYKVLDISDEIYLDVFPGINLFKANNDTEIGLNLGGSLRILTNANVIYIEPKYNVGTYDSFVITGGFIF
jgi:hypothetical protein